MKLLMYDPLSGAIAKEQTLAGVRECVGRRIILVIDGNAEFSGILLMFVENEKKGLFKFAFESEVEGGIQFFISTEETFLVIERK